MQVESAGFSAIDTCLRVLRIIKFALMVMF
jgi:hypothetical protein